LTDIDKAPEVPVATAGLGSRALRNTAMVLAAKVVARVLALITVIATLKHLHEGPYGTFTTVISYTAIVSVVLDLGFNVLYVREGARHPAEIQRYLRNVMSLRLVMAVGSLVVLAIALAIAGLSSLLVPGFVLMVLTSYSTLLRNTLYAVQRLTYEAVAVVLESAVLLGLVLIGIKVNGGVTFFVWAYAGQYAFSCAYFAAVLAWKKIAVIGWRFEPQLLRQWFFQSLPFALTFVLTILYFKVDQPILFAIRGQVEAGWYAAAYKPFEALLFIPMTLLSVVFPVLSVYFRERPQELTDAVSRFFKALLVVGWPIAVGLLMLAHPLTTMFLYPKSEPALRILALALAVGFVNNAFIGALSAADRQSSFTWAAGWSLLANVGLNLMLIPFFGYIGASIATVMTEVVLGVAGWILTRRHIGKVPVLQMSWRPILAGLVMGAVLFPLRNLDGVEVLIPIAVGGAVYIGAALLLRAITSDEIAFARRALALAR
jgi:O-antigen/teichoic acid export membrane protein